MFVELILLAGIVISVYFALSNYAEAKLYKSNEELLQEEKKRYKNDFKASGFTTPRGPSMSGNKYVLDENGEIEVVPEERSALISYI